MRLEVIIGSDEPIIFPINSNKLTIGSVETCDIVLSSEGVSRKHVTVIVEDDKYFISDLGSTNGTYMNETRLVPGRKVEFTSFFPVRLGHNVLISLLSDDDEDYASLLSASPKESTSPSMKRPVLSNQDSTVTISLKELRKTSTQELVKARDKKRVEIRTKTRQPVKKKKEKSNLVPVLAFCVLGVGVYYNFFVPREDVQSEPVERVGRLVETVKPKSVEIINNNLVPKNELPTKEQFNALLDNPKCIIDIEKYFCDLLDVGQQGQFGAVQIGTSINLLIDAKDIFSEVDTFLKPPVDQNDESLKQYEKLKLESAVYLFFLKSFPEKLDLSLLGDNKIIIGLYEKTDEGSTLKVNAAIFPKAYNELRPELKENFYLSLKDSGLFTFTIPHRFYTTF